MARSSSLSLPLIADWPNLEAAVHRAARGACSTPAVAKFLSRLEPELICLRAEILDGTVEVGSFTQFVIHDPKPRTIKAPVFRERVLQHAVMAYAGPVLDRTLIADTFACRVGKGTIAAIKRAQHHSRRFTWYGQIDIRHYFANVNHDVLLAALDRRFRDQGIRALIRRIVQGHADACGQGLPIGALCSQHFANYYLGPLDRAVLEQSPARAMVRYMDDVVCWADSRADVVQALQVAERVVRDVLRLEFREAPTINRVDHGLSFCGFRIFPGILRALPRRRRRYIEARRRWESRFVDGAITSLELQRGYDAAAGILAQVESAAWRRKQLELSPPPPECDDA